MPIPNLHETVNRCQAGDTTAFRRLMEEYQGYAFALALRTVCDEEEARDVVQEAFIRVWKSIGAYDPAVKFTTWLYSIVTRLCLDALRSRAHRPRTGAEEDWEHSMNAASAAAGDDPERTLSNKELASAIAALTETLPPTQRMVFVLRDLQELSVREVAKMLHLSEGSVKTNLVYARRCLRPKLERYRSEEGEV